MPSKFVLEVNLTNVGSIIKGKVVRSGFVVNQYLHWCGAVGIESNHLCTGIFCGAPPNISDSWKCEADIRVTLLRLNSDDPTVGFEKRVSITFDEQDHQQFVELGLSLQDFLKGDYMKDNRALIRIEIEAGVPSGLHLDEEKDQLSPVASEPRLCRTLCLLRSGKGFNVTLVTKDGTRVKAHSHILMAGSPVFVAMLETTAETTTNTQPTWMSWIASFFTGDRKRGDTIEVQLPDMTTPCLESILEYIYGAPLSNLDGIDLSLVQQLIPAAEKHELQELKEYCGHLIVEKWVPEKLLELYQTTMKYNFEGPRMKLQKVMEDHVPDILDQMAFSMMQMQGNGDH